MQRHVRAVLQKKESFDVPQVQISAIEFVDDQTNPPRSDQMLIALRVSQRRVAMFEKRKVFVELHTYSKAHKEAVQELVQILHSVNPRAMGILRSPSFFYDESRGWGLIYSIPEHLEISTCYTLGSVLLDYRTSRKLYHPLNERF